MKYTLLVLFTLLSTFAHAQSASPVCESPETLAYFPSGSDSLNRFTVRNFQLHKVGTEHSFPGKASVIFIVETDGSIGNAEILHTSGNPEFDKEAVRLAKAMPPWAPARDKGKTVRSTAILPLSFRTE